MAIMRTGTVTRAIWPYVIQRGHHQASRYVVSGITRDSSGTVLPFCNVELYEAQTSVRAGVGISDANGVYEIEPSGYPRSAMFFARAWKADGRTNFIRNNTMQGTPEIGTTGAGSANLPNLWSTPGGHGTVVKTVSDVGEDANGNPFIALRYNGTTSTTSHTMAFERPAEESIQAGSADTLTLSVYLSLIAGSLANVTAMAIGFTAYSSDGASLGGAAGETFSVFSSISAEAQRFEDIWTPSNANTAFVLPRFVITWNNATAVDFTLQFGVPQVDKVRGSVGGMTDVIKTYGEVRTIYDLNAIEGTSLPTLIVA